MPGSVAYSLAWPRRMLMTSPWFVCAVFALGRHRLLFLTRTMAACSEHCAVIDFHRLLKSRNPDAVAGGPSRLQPPVVVTRSVHHPGRAAPRRAGPVAARLGDSTRTRSLPSANRRHGQTTSRTQIALASVTNRSALGGADEPAVSGGRVHGARSVSPSRH